MVELLADAVVDLLDGIGDSAKRCTLIRVGERQPIPTEVRRAVWIRDRRECDWCGRGSPLELDHIVPWSAGGSDRSDNLRILCADCNTARSNYPDPARPRRLPCTYACDYDARAELYDEYQADLPLVGAEAVRCFCVTCRCVSWCSAPAGLV